MRAGIIFHTEMSFDCNCQSAIARILSEGSKGLSLDWMLNK